MAKYILSARATADLDGIWNYTELRWGLDQAEEYTNTIRGDLAFLVEHPERRRPCGEIRPEYFKHSSGSHVVFYRLSGENLFVARILHQRMDFRRHL